MDSGRSTAWHKKCNNHADHFAKRGSDSAEHLSLTTLDREAYNVIKRWNVWLTLLVANWPSDTQVRRPRRARSSGEAVGAPRAKSEGSQLEAVQWLLHGLGAWACLDPPCINNALGVGGYLMH